MEPTTAWLKLFNTEVSACQDCKHAQQAMDAEYGGDYINWCPRHTAEMYAWWDARRAGGTHTMDKQAFDTMFNNGLATYTLAMTDRLAAAEQRAQQAEARERWLRDALETYGEHQDGCAIAKQTSWFPGDPIAACTCGLAAALAAPARVEALSKQLAAAEAENARLRDAVAVANRVYDRWSAYEELDLEFMAVFQAALDAVADVANSTTNDARRDLAAAEAREATLREELRIIALERDNLLRYGVPRAGAPDFAASAPASEDAV